MVTDLYTRIRLFQSTMAYLKELRCNGQFDTLCSPVTHIQKLNHMAAVCLSLGKMSTWLGSGNKILYSKLIINLNLINYKYIFLLKMAIIKPCQRFLEKLEAHYFVLTMVV